MGEDMRRSAVALEEDGVDPNTSGTGIDPDLQADRPSRPAAGDSASDASSWRYPVAAFEEACMTRFLPLLLIGVALIHGGAQAQERSERLTLDSAVTTVRGQIKGRDSVQYSFTAKPHQQLSISLATGNPSNYFNVEREDLTEAVCQGALTGNLCSVRSDTAAHYVVDVFLMRNAARRGE
eukprot:Opistho-1_new@93610